MENNNIRQKTVVEQLMKEIRSMIANGTYKNDDKIPTESELAAKYGVSRTSVREAVKTLSYLGILESHTSKGTRISTNNRIAEEATAWSVILGFEKMKEVFALGTALDTQVAILVIENLKKSSDSHVRFVKDMKAIVKRMHKAANDNDLGMFTYGFSQYFRLLYNASNNTVFISLNECIDSLIAERVCKSYHQTGKLKDAVELLASTWETINLGSLQGSIEAIQKYGEFAFSIFTLCDLY